MHFDLVDTVLEQSDERIVTLKQVSAAEEYLQDHFPTYPVLPGVLMLEAMVQSARRLANVIEPRDRKRPEPWVLGRVRTLRYGSFVRPGSSLRVEIDLKKRTEDGELDFTGKAVVLTHGSGTDEAPPTAANGRFCLRRARLAIATLGNS